jgi:Protein of unknown function (DUF3349)
VALPPILSNIVDFLRAGYPDGVPEHDYIPLFALLARQLSEQEVSEVADELALTGDSDSAEALHSAIRNVTHERPLDSDIARVSARLAAAGWPLAAPHSTGAAT